MMNSFAECLRLGTGVRIPQEPSLLLRKIIIDSVLRGKGNLTIDAFLGCLQEFYEEIDSLTNTSYIKRKGIKVSIGDLNKKKNKDWWLKRLPSNPSRSGIEHFIQNYTVVINPPHSEIRDNLLVLKECLDEELKDLRVSPLSVPTSPELELKPDRPVLQTGNPLEAEPELEPEHLPEVELKSEPETRSRPPSKSEMRETQTQYLKLLKVIKKISSQETAEKYMKTKDGKPSYSIEELKEIIDKLTEISQRKRKRQEKDKKRKRQKRQKRKENIAKIIK